MVIGMAGGCVRRGSVRALGPRSTSAFLRNLAPTPRSYRGQKLTPAFVSPEPFCMTIDKPMRQVKRDILRAFRDLGSHGYEMKGLGSNPQRVTTNFVANSHRAAKWLDRYTIYSSTISRGMTAVFVLREVYISRDDKGAGFTFQVRHRG